LKKGISLPPLQKDLATPFRKGRFFLPYFKVRRLLLLFRFFGSIVDDMAHHLSNFKDYVGILPLNNSKTTARLDDIPIFFLFSWMGHCKFILNIRGNYDLASGR